jgi:DNA repair protein RadC
VNDRPLRIRELPANQRPLQRIAEVGAPALSDAELLAALVGAPSLEACHLLLARCGDWNGLRRATPADLTAVGLPAKAAGQLAAACELHRRLTYLELGPQPQIRSPIDAVAIAQAEIGHRDQEHLITLLLDGKNRVQAVETVYVGSVSSDLLRAGEVFKAAVRRNLPALIVAHNHTAGDPTPSPDDIVLTRQLVEAGRLLDVEVLDSLIVAGGRYVSMREHGLGFAA